VRTGSQHSRGEESSRKREWRIDYHAPSGGVNFTGGYQPSSSFVTVTAVPEPSAYVMLAIAGGIAAIAAGVVEGEASW